MTIPNLEPTQYVLLICSVGGAPEPIVESLLYWKPVAVRFIVSPQTRQQVDVVLRSYAERAGQPLSPGCHECVPVGDPQDLGGVVTALRPLASTVDAWTRRGNGYGVVVDFTAGTKCMSAALAVASHRWSCRFSYVGGDRRSKDGVGVVESGAERVVRSANPWDAFGYVVVEEAVTVFNHGSYAAAAEVLHQARRRATDPSVKRELSTLQAVTEAYAAWDRFDHATAQGRFADALKNRNDLLAMFTDPRELILNLQCDQAQVTDLAGQRQPARVWVEDLLRNARRRAVESRHDDAVARLYRAFEALAQLRLREQHGIADTKSVALEKLPDERRQQWKDLARDGKVSIGLQEAYAVLLDFGDELGQKFDKEGLNGTQSPLVARNQSILAHGFQSVGEPAYSKLHDSLCSLGPFSAADPRPWHLPVPR